VVAFDVGSIHLIEGDGLVESPPIFVGLDYHSGSVQACVVDAAG
jgi:predicted cupin superfamily sugar epimerase